MLVDAETHSEDAASLAALGVSEFPSGTLGPGKYDDVIQGHDGLSEWLSSCRRHYQQNVNAAATWSYLEPRRLTLPKGWMFLPMLAGSANAKLTGRMLGAIGRGEFSAQLDFKHSTVANYQTIQVPHPLPWFALRHGSVRIGETTVPLATVVVRRHLPVLAKIPDWRDLLPALEKLPADTPPPNPDLRSLWDALAKLMATPAALRDDSLRELWVAAASDGFAPESLHTDTGDIPLSEVFVTTSLDLARRARTPQRIVVTLDDAALTLWLGKGARDLSELVGAAWETIAAPAGLLTSIIPELGALDADGATPLVLRRDIIETARCLPVSTLMLKIAGSCEAVPCLMWQNTLLVDWEQLSPLVRAERLRLLLNEVAAAGWLTCEQAEALRRLGDAQVDERRAKVAAGGSLAEKLLLAMDGKSAPLLAALGDLATKDFIQQCTPHQLAELTLAQFGPATLSVLRNALAAEGLKPPARWNTAEARAFVACIGFPVEFAASPEARREAEEFISGPIELPPLHDFQDEVLEGIRKLVGSGTTRRRAVVNLPTGGGKTRVTVEAAVRLVLAPESDRRSVIWIAQTDELCEQAVQAFRQVWLNLGAQRTDLRIVRLWGGNPNPAIRETDKPLVVVASIQTLSSRMGADELEHLEHPGMVVVDECHHAIAPTYTKLLQWLDAAAPRAGEPQRDEPPIIGLSATPFRRMTKKPNG